jgi:hypothetical protein
MSIPDYQSVMRPLLAFVWQMPNNYAAAAVTLSTLDIHAGFDPNP